MTNKGFLIILDGWGHGPDPSRSAIAQANTPFVDALYRDYPNSELITYGEDVGLPEGQMGNSEVGHLNIGAGRIVYQELARINKAIRDRTLFDNPTLNNAFHQAAKSGKPVHFIGLVSDGGVHSHINHLKALIEMAESCGCEKVFIHAFMDGRDTDPKSGVGYLRDLQHFLQGRHAQIATVIGRYFAMDRDKRWERVKLAYDLLVHGEGRKTLDPVSAVESSYHEGVTDEFLKPIVVTDMEGHPLARIQDGDTVMCFNFRTDRPRQITQVLTQQDFPEQGMKALKLDYVTMTEYDKEFKGLQVVFTTDNLVNTMGEVVSSQGLTQVRIAETEKYPHVSFFFSGGREEKFPGEDRILIPSPKVATYDLQPEMSAIEVTDAIMNRISNDPPDFICLNFANTDMVGHTGVFTAAIKAAETVDTCLSRLIPLAIEKKYRLVIIADHGNSDYMINDDGTPNTAHTKNPVPCIVIYPGHHYEVSDGILADVAPTLLHLMGIAQPREMTGHSLIRELKGSS
ncbi:MAG: 2,3-bisphosphoglycerate-independent phosphoglycerate mutase [Saprospiraceae bacterium]|nr:2,3-bisphosphoglycerate-independent phosphoglycerate mutase [Saprospiraceae bacterium]MCB9320837.1 2,3-bisphosphoglycerate-independent phosphoglycerate mutase [Lewinellaceae bacterium]